jgi:hypothetical protein
MRYEWDGHEQNGHVGEENIKDIWNSGLARNMEKRN